MKTHKSIRLESYQIAFCKRFAKKLKADFGINVSISDVVRMALDVLAWGE